MLQQSDKTSATKWILLAVTGVCAPVWFVRLIKAFWGKYFPPWSAKDIAARHHWLRDDCHQHLCNVALGSLCHFKKLRLETFAFSVFFLPTAFRKCFPDFIDECQEFVSFRNFEGISWASNVTRGGLIFSFFRGMSVKFKLANDFLRKLFSLLKISRGRKFSWRKPWLNYWAEFVKYSYHMFRTNRFEKYRWTVWYFSNLFMQKYDVKY